ncbi:uncharacterized protein LOC119672548 [Teleopsis dalmanni]|uniref:uncharacterized protein LOC119672548 n=1 Tax=Teleopsis dalmanni TaxID=139649 RepID=UPI0018CC904D|nr:uncharacterized protein LOC119672548 [Teleopsis dalmanni]
MQNESEKDAQSQKSAPSGEKTPSQKQSSSSIGKKTPSQQQSSSSIGKKTPSPKQQSSSSIGKKTPSQQQSSSSIGKKTSFQQESFNSVGERTLAQQQQYTKQLEEQLYNMQQSHIALIVQYNRVLCRVRQIVNATPLERCKLVDDLKSIAFSVKSNTSITDEIPSIRSEACSFGTINRKCDMMFATLRSLVGEFNDAYTRHAACFGFEFEEGEEGEECEEEGDYLNSDSQTVIVSKEQSNQSKNSKLQNDLSQEPESNLSKTASKASKNSKVLKEMSYNDSASASKQSKHSNEESLSKNRTSSNSNHSRLSKSTSKGSKK